ncbi:hypothetical protein [Moraxella lacunata]|uniref:hypothetical protein n=1 Tax=Moraxella lacunata TaxID=477 RepID=UPI003EE3AB8D
MPCRWQLACSAVISKLPLLNQNLLTVPRPVSPRLPLSLPMTYQWTLLWYTWR